MVNLVAWIILYASFWLTKHNPVSTAFRRRECHTGFLAKWLEKTKFLTYARVYVTGSDLWETSKIRDGWDPEASREVTAYGRYPFTRNVTFGLNLTF